MSYQNFTAEIYNPNTTPWDDIKNEIIPMEQEAFGNNAFTPEQLSIDFHNKMNTISLLKPLDSDTVIGFTYARPIDEVYEERADEKGKTAFMYDTVINKKFRGKKLLGLLMDSLEMELKKRGYKYLEREAMIANNFAENISKHYKGRIVKQSEPHDSIYGPQIFFRIRLSFTR